MAKVGLRHTSVETFPLTCVSSPYSSIQLYNRPERITLDHESESETSTVFFVRSLRMTSGLGLSLFITPMNNTPIDPNMQASRREDTGMIN
jgi:hypothetical protein